jgi:hypothetical protein
MVNPRYTLMRHANHKETALLPCKSGRSSLNKNDSNATNLPRVGRTNKGRNHMHLRMVDQPRRTRARAHATTRHYHSHKRDQIRPRRAAPSSFAVPSHPLVIRAWHMSRSSSAAEPNYPRSRIPESVTHATTHNGMRRWLAGTARQARRSPEIMRSIVLFVTCNASSSLGRPVGTVHATLRTRWLDNERLVTRVPFGPASRYWVRQALCANTSYMCPVISFHCSPCWDWCRAYRYQQMRNE